MKKSLFYSVAIAAAMASCTQEAIEVPSYIEQDLSIRPVLDEVVLTTDEAVASRFAAGEGARPVFSENDKIGAAIMDMPLYPAQPYNSTYKSSNYSIVEYYSSNAAFTYDGNAWYLNEDQPLVEGNYLFYAPYNQYMQFRTPFEVRVPQKQTADTDKAALDEYYASGAVVRIGHNFLAANNGVAQRPSVKFFDVMSYPKFTIENNFDGYLIQQGTDHLGNPVEKVAEYTGAMKVDSIQLVFKNALGNGVVIGGLLSNEGLASTLASDWSLDPRNDETADLLNPSAQIKTYSTITTLVTGGREIAKGEKAVFYAVMPAVKYGAGELNANVYVTIGEKHYIISSANVVMTNVADPGEEAVYEPQHSSVVSGHTFATTSGSITMLPGQSYPQEEMNYNATTGKWTAKSIYGRALTLKLVGGKATVDPAQPEPPFQVAYDITLDEEGDPGAVQTDLIDNNEEFIQFFMDMESASDLVESDGTDKNGSTPEKDDDYVIDYDNAEFAFSANTTATINSDLINALAEYTYDGTITINTALPIANDVKVYSIDGNVVTFKSNTNKYYPITLGAEYDTTDGLVKSTGKSVHVPFGASWEINTPVTYGNVRNDGTITLKSKFAVPAFVNNSTLNLNTSSNIINKFANNGTVNVNDADAIATIGEGVGYIDIAQNVQPASGNTTIKYVVVTGGTQTGRYYATSGTAAQVAEAEKISWVKEFWYNDIIDFAANDIASKVVDITTLNIKGATFNDVKTFDMKNLIVKFANYAPAGDIEVTGTSLSQTTVKNITFSIASGKRVVLKDIAAVGSKTGELYANGVDATWNGDAEGVEPYVFDVISNTYTVNTATGWNKIAALVNAGDNLAGKTIVLANDINGAGLESMGDPTNQSQYTPCFSGTFDGNGKTISNLNITDTDCYAGLFGMTDGAIIKNLKINGAEIKGHHCVGALVGQAYNGTTIENIEVSNANIICTWKDADDSGDKAGVLVGILNAGEANLSTISNCTISNSTVSASRDAGQVVGMGKETNVTECTVTNVKVSANGTGTGINVGTNINDDIIGRKN